MLTLYDLAGAQSERRFSPYCWRIRLALAHKGLAVDAIPWRFVDKEALAFSGRARVPVLVHDGKSVTDSSVIANYLEETFAGTPPLFGGAHGRALTRMYAALGDVLVGTVARFVMLDGRSLSVD